MAQALEKVNMSPNLGEKSHRNGYTFPKFSFWRNPVFSKVFDQYKKATPYPFTTSPCATNPNNILLLLQAPAKRRYRKKKLKFWRWRAAAGAHLSEIQAQY